MTTIWNTPAQDIIIIATDLPLNVTRPPDPSRIRSHLLQNVSDPSSKGITNPRNDPNDWPVPLHVDA